MGGESFQFGSVDALRAGRYGLSTNTHVFCYRIGQTLIDTGPPNQWRTIRPWIEEQAKTHGIRRVVVTHHHEDHAGNAGRIADLLDVPVYAPAASCDRLREGFSVELYRWVVWGRPQPVEAQPMPDVLPLDDGTALRMIPAPGHADDMVCYLAEGHGLLFTADLYISRRPHYLRFDEHVSELVESLHRVLAHDFDTVLCGHRGAVTNGCAALRDKARYLEAMCGVVQRRRRSDKRSVDFIRNEMLGREGWLYWISGGDFSKRNLITSCLQTPTEDDFDPGEIFPNVPDR